MKWRQQAIAPMRDHFADWRGVRSHDPTTRGHRFDKRPRQYKRIGQIYMHRGYLRQREKLFSGQMIQKVYARKIDLGRNFIQAKTLPIASVWSVGSIRRRFPADDDNVSVRSFAQDFGHRSKKYMKSAHRLQASRGVCHDFMLGRENHASRQGKTSQRIRSNSLDVHTLVHDLNF